MHFRVISHSFSRLSLQAAANSGWWLYPHYNQMWMRSGPWGVSEHRPLWSWSTISASALILFFFFMSAFVSLWMNQCHWFVWSSICTAIGAAVLVTVGHLQDGNLERVCSLYWPQGVKIHPNIENRHPNLQATLNDAHKGTGLLHLWQQVYPSLPTITGGVLPQSLTLRSQTEKKKKQNKTVLWFF